MIRTSHQFVDTPSTTEDIDQHAFCTPAPLAVPGSIEELPAQSLGSHPEGQGDLSATQRHV